MANSWCITELTEWCRLNRGPRNKQFRNERLSGTEIPSRAHLFWRMSFLRGCGAGGAVLEHGNQLLGIAGRRQTSLAHTDDGDSFVGGKMRQGFLECPCKMEPLSLGSYTQDGLAKSVDLMRSLLEGLRGGIIGAAGDDHLHRMARKQRGCKAVGGGKHSVLGCDASKGFERFLSKVVIAKVAGKGMHANQCDGRDGVCAGSWRVLKRFAANVEAAHRGSIRRPIEKPAAFRITVEVDRNIHRFFRSIKIARLERRFVGVEQGKNAEDLVVERTIERWPADAMYEPSRFAPRFLNHAVHRFQRELPATRFG